MTTNSMLLTNFNSELYICQYKAIEVHRGWAGVLYYPVKKLGVCVYGWGETGEGACMIQGMGWNQCVENFTCYTWGLNFSC